MILSTYHAHTDFCDGSATAEEMVLAAIERGCAEIGFSGHSPIPGEDYWCMSESGAVEYRDALSALREKYKGKIRIYIGVEQDVISTTTTESYDFVIGSVHGLVREGKMLPVDIKPEIVKQNVDTYYGGDPYAYVEDYYLTVSEAYLRTGCDIIGHFDLVTKFIEREPFFSVSHPRYIAARDAALERLLMSPALFEVNTGAIARGYRTAPYPEMAVIERIAAAGKPLVINSDAHTRDTVDFLLAETAMELDRLKIPYVTTLDEVLSLTRG